MEVSEVHCEQDRLQLIASKALRERWLLDGAPSAGQEQDEVRRQLEQDEAKTRSLEDTINRLEQELIGLETGTVCETRTHPPVTSGPPADSEVKGQDGPAPLGQVFHEMKVHKSPQVDKPSAALEEMKRAMYSVEIKVERDRVTGETRVLSTNTTLPVDLSHQGVKVYEDERKVVHEVNGEDGVHLLSCSEVEELIHKADEASMMSQTVTTVHSRPTVEVQEQAAPESLPQVAVEITGLEAKAGVEPGPAEATAENPVTMVFMGYQSVEDEDETRRVLGLQGTVKAKLVHIDNGKTSPGGERAVDPPPPTTPLTSTKPPETTTSLNGETAGEAGEAEGGPKETKKEKQPCKCCSIM
ncbi:paralemmin 1a isoform X2 [Parambassis ranga]|uniref:Paralemmin-1 n=1 Tax=Parambassis ranga TaxID=210632 RepID=A0A6P7HTE9_9TELE|nr:paralemmin-1 isoform X2 [Parambassis ranga]